MPEPASLDRTAHPALRALGARAFECLLRRSGSLLVPENLPGESWLRETGSIPLSIVMAGAEPGFEGPAVLLKSAPALAPLRAIIGPLPSWALITPLSSPSTEGAHDLYALIWAPGEPPPDGQVIAQIRDSLIDRSSAWSAHASAASRASLDLDAANQAFDASSHGLILLSAQGTILRINRSASRAAGPEVRLAAGQTLRGEIADQAAGRIESLMQLAAAGASANEEIDLIGEEAGRRVFHVGVDAVRMGGEPAFLVSLRDLTERDRLVELLRREKDFTRSLLEAANACVLGLDVQGRTILFNRVFQDLTDYRLADVLGREAIDLLVPEDQRPAWRDAHLLALSGGKVEDQDFCVRSRSGTTRLLSLSAGRIHDAAGACRGVLWTGRDVTLERRRARELRAREETTSRSLRQLKEFSRISSMILQEKDLDSVCKMFVDAVSTVSTFHRAILTLCDDDFRGYEWYFAGLNQEDIDTFHRNKMTNRERITIFQEKYRLGNSYYIPHTERWHYEGVRSNAESEEMVDWHPDDFLFIPLYGTNHKIVGIVSVDDPEDGRTPSAESISPLELFANQVAHSIEEKKLDQEVRQTTERYRTLVETMYDGVLTVDLRERVVFANPAFAQLVGFPETLISGRPLGSLLEPEDLAVFRTEAGLQEGGREARFEVRLRAQSGEHIPVHVSASPFREDRTLMGCFAVVRDLREQKKAEVDRKAMQEQLMQAEKLSALGELISGIAHELNNPLTGVMGYSQLLLNSSASAESKGNLEKIHREAVRCQKIVQNLLTFARRRSPERKMLDVNALVEATLELREYQLRVDGIKIVKELAPDLPRTLGDFHQLQQVFINLINNAHHAMLEGGKPGRLTLRTELSGDGIRVVVADNGPGIPDDCISKIFDPFFTTKEIGKGTGLGLSLSYGIVKEHEGRIGVRSHAGEGATFLVDLPIRQDAAEPQEAAVRQSAPGPVAGKHILVVDDEETILDLLESVLEISGHHVERAQNGRQALEKVQRDDFDIIISDVKMPDMGGQKLYECIAELKPHLRRRVVFSTGDTVNPITQELFQRTGNHFLAKPFRLEEVDAIIARVVEEAESLKDPAPA
jgi:PAS domain S-box-containing protein